MYLLCSIFLCYLYNCAVYGQFVLVFTRRKINSYLGSRCRSFRNSIRGPHSMYSFSACSLVIDLRGKKALLYLLAIYIIWLYKQKCFPEIFIHGEETLKKIELHCIQWGRGGGRFMPLPLPSSPKRPWNQLSDSFNIYTLSYLVNLYI